MTSNFNIFTWNVNGIGGYKKDVRYLTGLFNHSTALVEQKWWNQWRGKVFSSHGTSNSTGILISITEDLDCKVKNELHDKNGRILILDIEIQSEHYEIINYYSSNDQHGQLETLSGLESLLDKINFRPDTKIILRGGGGGGGDFNVIFDTFLDADGGSPTLKTNSLNKISTLSSHHDLCDIFRVRFPETQKFSWRQKNPLIQRRLDCFFTSNEI